MDFDKILGDIPEGLSQYELARYIYIKLGQHFLYDEEYYIADTLEERKEIFDRNIDEIKENKVVCSQFSKMYIQLLQKYGIESNYVFSEGSGDYVGHSFVTTKIDDKLYYTDMTRDLLQIKTGLKTNYFMKVPEYYKGTDDEKLYDEISDEELKEIDSKVGYTYKGMYMDETIKLLKSDMQALNDENSEYGRNLRETLGIKDFNKKDLLEYKIEFLKKYFDNNNLASRDKVNYFAQLLNTPEERKNFDVNEVSCADKEHNAKMLLHITDKELGDNSIYIFTDDEFANKIDEDFVQNLIDEGLRPESKEREKAEKLLKIAGYSDEYIKDNIDKIFPHLRTEKLGEEVIEEMSDVSLTDETEANQNRLEEQRQNETVVGEN